MENEVQDMYKGTLEKLGYKDFSVFQERVFVNGENIVSLLLEYLGKRQLGKTDTVIIEYLSRPIPENPNLRWCYYYSFAANLIIDMLLSSNFTKRNLEFNLVRVRTLAEKADKKIDMAELVKQIDYIKYREYNVNDIHSFDGKSIYYSLLNLKVGEKLYYANNKDWYIYKDTYGRVWQRYDGISQLFKPNLKMLFNEWWHKGDKFMNLNEAIKYFELKAENNTEKYAQVVKWLKELKEYKEKDIILNSKDIGV